MKKITIFSFLFLSTFAMVTFSASVELYAFHTKEQEIQFSTLTHELRCLVCQNQDLADSNAPLAADLRNEIANKIQSGQTNSEIIAYLVKRYGDYILYKPPFIKTTWILWVGPFILLVLSLIVLFTIITVVRRHKKAETQDLPTV